MKSERELDAVLDEVCADIHRDISGALKAAERDGKKLIILLGEGHEGGLSLLAQCIFLSLACTVGIKNVYVELDQKTYQEMLENKGYLKNRRWISFTPIFEISRVFEMNIIPVDSTLTERVGKTTAVMIDRSDKLMSETINLRHDHALHIVGLMHLTGILRDYPLDPDKYIVITYNLCDTHQALKDSIISSEKRLSTGNHFWQKKEETEFSLPRLRYMDTAKDITHLLDRLQHSLLENLSNEDYIEHAVKAYLRHMQRECEEVVSPK